MKRADAIAIGRAILVLAFALALVIVYSIVGGPQVSTWHLGLASL